MHRKIWSSTQLPFFKPLPTSKSVNPVKIKHERNKNWYCCCCLDLHLSIHMSLYLYFVSGVSVVLWKVSFTFLWGLILSARNYSQTGRKLFYCHCYFTVLLALKICEWGFQKVISIKYFRVGLLRQNKIFFTHIFTTLSAISCIALSAEYNAHCAVSL